VPWHKFFAEYQQLDADGQLGWVISKAKNVWVDSGDSGVVFLMMGEVYFLLDGGEN
jgi:hypothetical protein